MMQNDLEDWKQLLLYEGAGHGFSNQEPWFEETLAHTRRFFANLGWI